MRTRWLAIVGLGALLAWVGAVDPAAAEDTGSVTGTVTVEGGSGACLTIDTESVSFGALPLSTATTVAEGFSSPTYLLENCSSSEVTLFARSTDAVAAGTTWSLEPPVDPATGDFTGGNPCSLGTDIYHAGVFDESLGIYTDTTDAPWRSLAADGVLAVDSFIAMACEGSSGAGQTLSMSYVYTAVP